MPYCNTTTTKQQHIMEGDEDVRRDGPEEDHRRGDDAAASVLPEEDAADMEEVKPRGANLIEMNENRKRKKGLGRHSTGQQKKSSFNFPAARAHHDLPPSAPSAQVEASMSRSAPVPPKPRSPPKEEVKRELRRVTKKLKMSRGRGRGRPKIMLRTVK